MNPGERRGGMSRTLLLSFAALGAVVVLAFALTIRLLGPVPPRTVVMSTGPEGGDYHEFGLRYRETLARSGVELKLIASDGALENLKRLKVEQSGVNAGLVQGGLTTGRVSPELVSLGTVFYEPLWIFHRGGKFDRRLKDLRGKRVSIGPPESGTRALVLELLWRNRIDTASAQLLPLASQEAADGLLQGKIDVAFMLASWESQAVQRLLADPDIEIASFPQVDAYIALYPYLTRLTLPAGVADLAAIRPPGDVAMLAARTSLVVRKDLHPAIQYLLLDAAQRVHSVPAVFHRPGGFPAPEVVDVPLSDDALQFYKSGPPFLQRYLPFWLAILAGRLLLILIPVVGVLYPVMRLVPVLYAWGVRRRIFRLYGELKFLEAELDARAAEAGVEDLLERLDGIEDRANHLRVPTMFAQLLYTVRHHIGLVRRRIMQRTRPAPGQTAIRGTPHVQT